MTITPSPDAWFLSADGVPHDPAGARMASFLASGPKRGIVPAGPLASGDVIPTAVPSSSVRVLPFVAVAPNPASGHFGEAYVWRSRTTREVPIRATSSKSGRTDAIISRVWDEGIFNIAPPGDDYVTIEVIEDVDPGIESADTLAAAHHLDYPFVWHKNVTLPASTGTITAGMFTDRRYQIGGEVSHAERLRVGDLGGAQVLNTRDLEGMIFPSRGAQHQLFIPEWAGQMKIRFKWLDIQYWQGSNSYGRRWVRVGSGSNILETHKYYFDAPTNSGMSTTNWEVVDVLDIPEDMRGTTQRFEARAYAGSNADLTVVRIPEYGATALEVEFRETLN